MSLTSSESLRPLRWPSVIDSVAEVATNPDRLYLVGGVVRDALRGTPIHDIDLVTPDDGLRIARQLADALDGAYYPVDPERHTGRVLFEHTNEFSDVEPFQIDVASYRGTDLLADLTGRDFTINAMAVQLDKPDLLIDPLDGQIDLFQRKQLRMCSPTSISDDPVRALRAVRMALQFGLMMHPDTSNAVRENAVRLIGSDGSLSQPERVRDELFKGLLKTRPHAFVRLLHTLDLLPVISPFDVDSEQAVQTLKKLHDLLTIISPRRDDNIANELILGVAVMVLDRNRAALQAYLGYTHVDGREREKLLLLLATLTPTNVRNPGTVWGEWLRLSKPEVKALNLLHNARSYDFPALPLDDRAVYGYVQQAGNMGIGGVLLHLAIFLVDSWPIPDARQWGDLLEGMAHPIIDGFINRYKEIIDPTPIIDGNEIMAELNIKQSPIIGEIISLLKEEQAAGTVATREEALALAHRILEEGTNNP